MAVIFDNTNTDGVNDNPPSPTFIGIAQPTLIRRILLYFYNGTQGADPAMVVYLRQVPNFPPPGHPGPGSPDIWFGPFTTVLSAGQAAPNANVEVFPDIVVPAGRYQIVPTQPAKWSWNSRSGDMGFTRIEGDPVTPLPTTAPAPASNQYERANWSVSQGRPQKILWLQPTGATGPACYLAIYRITNSESSTLVTITTTGGTFTLQPGASVDVSAQRIDIESTGLPAWGTFQDLCCSIAVLQAPAALKDPFLWSFLETPPTTEERPKG